MRPTIHTLLGKCKCGVFLSVNQHRDYYQKAADYLKEMQGRREADDPLAEPDVLQKMIETDTVIELQFYPDTPIGSYTIYHYDLDMAIKEAMTCFPSNP